jgi:hypothetical protein
MTNSKRIKQCMAGGMLAAAVVACAMSGNPTTSQAIPELAGRAAGSPQRCVLNQQNQNLHIVDARTITYGSGKTIWVNRLGGDCPGMDPTDALVVEPAGSQYCRGDRIRPIDPTNPFPGPVCILGDFVPYTR